MAHEVETLACSFSRIRSGICHSNFGWNYDSGKYDQGDRGCGSPDWLEPLIVTGLKAIQGCLPRGIEIGPLAAYIDAPHPPKLPANNS